MSVICISVEITLGSSGLFHFILEMIAGHLLALKFAAQCFRTHSMAEMGITIIIQIPVACPSYAFPSLPEWLHVTIVIQIPVLHTEF